ncbi:MFS transporter [Luedemannella flava]|uniref:MFS transporter n=1 Tax=Luedemannella flava TaxID=349316 RepID=A0ABP4XV23_9ACTN
MRAGSYTVDRRPLAIPAFRRLWLASVVTAVGGSFSLIAIPTQLFTITGSSATVGASAIVTFVALTVSSLWCGALADRMDRRRLLLFGQCGLAGTYLLLWAQAALHVRSVPLLFVLIAFEGVSYGATMATMGAAVPRIVPTDLLAAANSLSSLVRYLGAVLGPVLAGALLPLVGLSSLYLFDSVALTAVIWAVSRLPAIEPPPRDEAGAGARATVVEIFDGFRYLWTRRILVAVLGIDLAAMVFGLPVALFPELAERTFGGPPGGGTVLGLLYAAYPAGVLLAGLFSGTFTRARRHGVMLAGATMTWGVTVVVLGVAPNLAVALAALVLGGAANFLLSTYRNAITQAHSDDALRGRVAGSLTVVLVGGPQASVLLHGLSSAAVGPRWTIVVGGLLTVATVALIVRLVSALWGYVPTAVPAPTVATSDGEATRV